jgi:hypothetical protein
MSLGVSEIRDTAARLKSAIAAERYATKAGIKERSAFGQLYEEHRLLREPGVLPALQRALAEATGDERRRLGWLLSWVADQRVEAQLAPLEDQLRTWESSATVRVGPSLLPWRRVPARVAQTADRAERLAWSESYNERLEDAAALQLDILYREREAVAELGFGDYVEARERLAGLNIRGLGREAVRILSRTEDAYRESLEQHVRARLAIDPADAARPDLLWLRRMPWVADRFGLPSLLASIQEDLAELGLPIEANGKIRLDLDIRPVKVTDSFSAALEVPGHVVLVAPRVGGWGDCESLLHEVGHVLHFAYTGAKLPFEYRVLGDPTVTETFALLFEGLVIDRGWVEATTGLEGAELEEYRRLASFLKLARLRLHAARLLYELELASADRPGQMAPRYVELISGATGFAYDERTYLEGVRRGFWVARQLRAWMLSSILHRVLVDRFDVEWYRNPAAGPFLAEILSAGQREDGGQLATQLGADRLTPELLLEDVAEWLA